MRQFLWTLGLLAACGGTGPTRGTDLPTGQWTVTGTQFQPSDRDYAFAVVRAANDTVLIDWIAGAMSRDLPARDTLLHNGTGGTFRAQFNASRTIVILFDFARSTCSGRDLWVVNDQLQTDDWQSCVLSQTQ